MSPYDSSYMHLPPVRLPISQGSVSDYLRSMGSPTLNELSAVNLILEPTMAALAHIHSLGMIHRSAGQPLVYGRINTPCMRA